jgi:hypothetical protein
MSGGDAEDLNCAVIAGFVPELVDELSLEYEKDDDEHDERWKEEIEHPREGQPKFQNEQCDEDIATDKMQD